MRLVCTALFVAVVLQVVGPGAAAQTGTEPTVPELIVPGDTGTTSAPPADGGAGELDPASPTTAAGGDQGTDSGSGGDGLSASTKVWVIIGALVGVALLVFILTIIYWRHTRPPLRPLAGEEAAEPGTAVASEPPESPEPPAPATPARAAAPATPVSAEEAGEELQAADSEPSGPRPVGSEPPTDPRRSVFAPQPEEAAPAEPRSEPPDATA